MYISDSIDLSHDRPRARNGGSLAARLLARLRLWQQRANGRRQLHTLDDRLLQDIGIDQVAARHEAGKPFWSE